MIDAIGITKHYGSEPVLKGVSLRIGKTDKIGIVGKNGAGKTTLAGILAGEDRDFEGDLRKTAECRVAYVRQSFASSGATAVEYMIEPFIARRSELARLEEEMSAATGRELESVLGRYGELRSRYDAEAGDGAEDRAVRYLAGIGLGDRADTPVSVLSGGERNALALGRALVARPDVLILDEPGNHLDIWGLAWLEGFIREYPGAVLVVSHNRYLLDRVANRIVEVEDGVATEYAGNYSAYRLERLRTAVSGEMAWKADEKKIARLEEVVRRFEEIARRTADPAWGRRLRARRTHLEKTRETAARRPDAPDASFSISFATDASKADFALRATGLSRAFPGKPLFENVSLTIRTGERVALVGENGSGKTTLLEEILARARTGDRSVMIGPSMTVSYCSQHGDGFARGETVFGACQKAGAKTEDEAWKALSRFLFSREVLPREIRTLSGGETNRLQLSLAIIARSNFLILDEPTNHLDIAACEAVEDALAEYDGTILAVSHDRYFLDRIATRVVEIDNGSLVEWEGNFSEFWLSRYGSSVRSPRKPAKKEASGTTRETPRKGAARTPANGNGDNRTRENIEARIMALEAEQRETEAAMNAAFSRGELSKARSLGSRLATITREIERLYERWS